MIRPFGKARVWPWALAAAVVLGAAGAGQSFAGDAEVATPPSRFGKLTSRRWAYGMPYVRENLKPVPNPNPAPEPQPRRDHPYDVAICGDGSKVYIALAGSELLPGSEVAVYDVARDEVVKRISLRPPDEDGAAGSSPFRLIFHPGGRFLLVTNRYSNFVSVIDTRSDTVVSEIPVDFYCQYAAFSQDGHIAYMTNRYLDQVFVLETNIDGDRFDGSMKVLGGLDDRAFFGTDGGESIHSLLARRCGECHSGQAEPPKPAALPRQPSPTDEFPLKRQALPQGGFVTGPDALQSFLSVCEHVLPGDSAQSRLLRAPLRTRHGGYADLLPKFRGHGGGVAVFTEPDQDPDFQALRAWINSTTAGPGIPVGNERSKPKGCALSSDGRYLFVGNTGTLDISIVDTRLGQEVGGIYLQNVVNDVKIYRSPATGRDYLLATTEGIGFGVIKERDPYGGETWDRNHPAAQFTVWRDPQTGKPLPREQQEVLGPFDAVDGTAEIKFRDMQNDLVMIDLGALEIPASPPADGLKYLLKVNQYEAHRHWVRYTSDTAESTMGDIKGDIPPDLMRVTGAFPEKMAVAGDDLFVTMQASNQVQHWRIDPTAAEPSDWLTPVAVYETGLQPIGIAAGVPGTPSAGQVYVANFLSGALTVIDSQGGGSRQVTVDPSVERLPVPATNAERGEVFVHSALFSSDGDTSCFHCHYLDMGEGRPWGVSQVLSQEFLNEQDQEGHLVIAGTSNTPQMRGLFGIQPFFLEGVISVYEPRSMMMEHCPSDDFAAPMPQGDYRAVNAHYVMAGAADIQSKMKASTKYMVDLEERRDEMFRRVSMRLFGKSFNLRDFQRFVGEWQAHEPRLLPNPFDPTNRSVLRGKKLFEDAQIGCVSCHPPPHFAKKDFPDNPTQSLPPVVMFTVRDGSFTLLGKNREDYLNEYDRDLEPWDKGRAEEHQGHFTAFPLRGIWDRPPVFLHNGMARTLREIVAPPGHPALRTFRYEPLFGGYGERPGRKEVGFNMTFVFYDREPKVKMHLVSNARLGFDTHGGTSQLNRLQVDDLVNFMNSIE